LNDSLDASLTRIKIFPKRTD